MPELQSQRGPFLVRDAYAEDARVHVHDDDSVAVLLRLQLRRVVNVFWLTANPWNPSTSGGDHGHFERSPQRTTLSTHRIDVLASFFVSHCITSPSAFRHLCILFTPYIIIKRSDWLVGLEKSGSKGRWNAVDSIRRVSPHSVVFWIWAFWDADLVGT